MAETEEIVLPQWCDMCRQEVPFVISYRMDTWRCPGCFGDRELPDNPLMDFVKANVNGRRLTKWVGYLDIYHQHLKHLRGKSPVILEIGVCRGGSLDMWKDYFGEGARIIGADIREPAVDCTDHEVHIGDQGDPLFLMALSENIGPVDVIIDDGGHQMSHMNTTFRHLYDTVNCPGFYIVEDLHTAFMSQYQDGTSFFQQIGMLTEEISGWHLRETPTRRMQTTFGIHNYESICVIEKRPIQRPLCFQSGLEKGQER